MEVRCGKCNKLFRVSDDKITGSGIKFVCSRCGEYVKITREEFEHYNLSKATASVLSSHEPKPAPAAASPVAVKDQTGSAPATPTPGFDLSEPSAKEFPPEDQTPPVFVKPASAPGPAAKPTAVHPKPQPNVEPKIEQRPTAPVMQPQTAAPKPVATARDESTANPPLAGPTVPSSAAKEAMRPSMPLLATPSAEPAASSGAGKKLVIFIAIVLIVIAASVFGAKWYFRQASQRVSDAAKTMTSPEGLQITNTSGAIDPGTQDLIITGSIQNITDKPRPAWYIVAEVFDAQNTVLATAKMLSGKQLYTRRDYEILVKRGQNMQDLKKKMQEQGVIIPPKGTVNFEIRIMEPPVGIASFNATLQPFDPVQLFKEIAEDQKQQ
jgi:hypothetical protein